jgi:hypothetical protein
VSSRWSGGGGGDDVEDAEHRVGVGVVVARDEIGEVQFVAGVEADASGEVSAECDLAGRVEEGEGDAVDLGRVGGDDVETGFESVVEGGVAPVGGERRVEDLARPVEEDGGAGLGEDAAIDPFVIVGAAGAGGERAGGEQDDAAAELFVRFALGFVGARDL